MSRRISKGDQSQARKNDDSKSFVNPKTNVRSKAYEEFVDPIDKGIRGGSLDKEFWFPKEIIDCCP